MSMASPRTRRQAIQLRILMWSNRALYVGLIALVWVMNPWPKASALSAIAILPLGLIEWLYAWISKRRGMKD